MSFILGVQNGSFRERGVDEAVDRIIQEGRIVRSRKRCRRYVDWFINAGSVRRSPRSIRLRA
jgi:hypothetical protein